jgi:hypothetical protein
MADRQKGGIQHGRPALLMQKFMKKPDFHKYANRNKIGANYVLKALLGLCILLSLAYLLSELFRTFVQQHQPVH